MRRLIAALVAAAVVVGCAGVESPLCRDRREIAESHDLTTKEICREAERRQDPEVLGSCDYCDFW